MLTKLESIISSLKDKASRVVKKNIKFGFRLPQTVNKAMIPNKNNGNHIWRDGIAKKIDGVMIAFKILDEGDNPPCNYQEIRCHMIFVINMNDFQRKARYVAGGHATFASPKLTYVSVVSQDSVRVAFTLSALNYLEVKTSGIHNAYLTATCLENIWTTLG